MSVPYVTYLLSSLSSCSFLLHIGSGFDQAIQASQPTCLSVLRKKSRGMNKDRGELRTHTHTGHKSTRTEKKSTEDWTKLSSIFKDSLYLLMMVSFRCGIWYVQKRKTSKSWNVFQQILRYFSNLLHHTTVMPEY